jgi:hypothetical protein
MTAWSGAPGSIVRGAIDGKSGGAVCGSTQIEPLGSS